MPTDPQHEAKLAAARAALAELPPEGVIGLGSGSTAKLFVDEVGARVNAGARYRGVTTSEGTRKQAEALGIPLLSDDEPWDIEVCVDGADEVDARLDLIKGGGGAQTREKIVSHASKKKIIIVDGTKLSTRLGEKWAVPIEVLRFGHAQTRACLSAFGEVSVRHKDGKPFFTDAGNYVFDVRTGPIDDAAALDRALRAVPGVVETGLFVGRTDVVLVAEPGGVRRIVR
jgi:ribose 5-phosphate isomerase A